MVVTSTTPPVCLFVQEQDAEKKVMNRTARAWYKLYAYSAKLDRIVDHNEGPKSTGAKGYVCPGTAKSTGAIFSLPLWVRRLSPCLYVSMQNIIRTCRILQVGVSKTVVAYKQQVRPRGL